MLQRTALAPPLTTIVSQTGLRAAMVRAWPTELAASIALVSLLGCASGPPPDEGSFKRLVAQMLVEAARRSGGTVDGGDPVKAIVFKKDSIPPRLRDLETMVKQGLEGDGIEWVDADLQGNATSLPGKRTTFSRDGILKFDRTHSVLQVSVEGSGREREVEWGLVCGPLCGYGQRVRFEWFDGTWGQEVVAEIRY